jgi:hypothetical protein
VHAVLALALGSAPLAAQATNPPYLAEFPTVAKVKQVMTDPDPRERALKQLGALWQLQEVIKQLSGHREFRGLLPDEANLVQSYYAAHYYVGKAIDSAYPGPYGNWGTVSGNTPYRYMRSDPRFGIEGIATFRLLLNPTIQTAFYTSVGADKAKIAARMRADSDAMLAASAAAATPSGPRTDAETMQMRRCAESGRSETECMMEGIGKSFSGLVSAAFPILNELKPAPIHGIRMSGIYAAGGGLSFDFYNDEVTVRCGELVPQSHEYSVTVTPAGLRITVANSPAPVALTLRADGKLAGAGPTDFAGQVQIGTQVGTRTWSDGRTEPISRPVFGAATLRCNTALLAATGPSSSTAPAALLSSVFGGADAKADKSLPLGARMSGEYGSQAALDLEFRPEGVVVGCREAASLRDYTVRASGNVALIHIVNGAAPLDLTYSNDGKVTGAGTVKVDGRMVTGTSGSGGLTYAPRSATCTLGALDPAGPQLSEAEKGAEAARASLGRPAARATTAPYNPGAEFAGNGASFVQLESGFPKATGGALPLAGQTIVLMDADLDKVFREAGVKLGLNEKFLAAFNQAYDAGGERRQKLLKAITVHTVGYFQLDKDGIGKSPELTVGKTYSFMTSGTVGGTKYLWSLTGVAKPGWTKVVLSAANALKD